VRRAPGVIYKLARRSMSSQPRKGQTGDGSGVKIDLSGKRVGSSDSEPVKSIVTRPPPSLSSLQLLLKRAARASTSCSSSAGGNYLKQQWHQQLASNSTFEKPRHHRTQPSHQNHRASACRNEESNPPPSIQKSRLLNCSAVNNLRGADLQPFDQASLGEKRAFHDFASMSATFKGFLSSSLNLLLARELAKRPSACVQLLRQSRGSRVILSMCMMRAPTP
jgi:hypothetical protein